MPQIQKLSEEEREVGKALAERAKLDPSVVLEDFTIQTHGDSVTVILEVFHKMSRAEFEAILAKVRSQR